MKVADTRKYLSLNNARFYSRFVNFGIRLLSHYISIVVRKEVSFMFGLIMPTKAGSMFSSSAGRHSRRKSPGRQFWRVSSRKT